MRGWTGNAKRKTVSLRLHLLPRIVIKYFGQKRWTEPSGAETSDCFATQMPCELVVSQEPRIGLSQRNGVQVFRAVAEASRRIQGRQGMPGRRRMRSS
jgi:hypothetical protein